MSRESPRRTRARGHERRGCDARVNEGGDAERERRLLFGDIVEPEAETGVRNGGVGVLSETNTKAARLGRVILGLWLRVLLGLGAFWAGRLRVRATVHLALAAALARVQAQVLLPVPSEVHCASDVLLRPETRVNVLPELLDLVQRRGARRPHIRVQTLEVRGNRRGVVSATGVARARLRPTITIAVGTAVHPHLGCICGFNFSQLCSRPGMPLARVCSEDHSKLLENLSILSCGAAGEGEEGSSRGRCGRHFRGAQVSSERVAIQCEGRGIGEWGGGGEC
jgi:hypothetical protein